MNGFHDAQLTMGKLVEVLRRQGVNRPLGKIDSFANFLEEALKRYRAKRIELVKAKNKPAIDIVYWICEAQRQGDLDEALWRAFLAGHFGRPSAGASSRESAGRFLCAFGSSTEWTWRRVSRNLNGFKSWLHGHEAKLKTLAFSNHRKFESKKPAALFRVIARFVDWVHESGQGPHEAFTSNLGKDPLLNFRMLYKILTKELRQFGRLGAFDTLWLVGILGLLPIRVDSCYLGGATGPLRGARLLWGNRTPQELTSLADECAAVLEIPFEVFEDALCGWQKIL